MPEPTAAPIPPPPGQLIISLDLELYWGIRDRKSLNEYRQNLLGVRQAVPAILELFKEHGIHATWAAVGFLFFEKKEELIKNIPFKKPYYKLPKLSPYPYLDNLGDNESDDPFHYAPSLIKLIRTYSYQEIGTHTFSHYYCLESGQDIKTFRQDLQAALNVARNADIAIDSIVFPRNQINRKYMSVCQELGIKAYRGNQRSFLYRGEYIKNIIIRFLRVSDSYFNISGYNTYSLKEIGEDFPFNIAASLRLLPYNPTMFMVEPLRLKRICGGLDHAARHGRIFHLWWHPHNFGVNLRENIQFLRKILNHFSRLQEEYGMESRNMGELAHFLLAKDRVPAPIPDRVSN